MEPQIFRYGWMSGAPNCPRELALKLGQAAGLAFQRGEHRHRVVIGKDTRLSGYMIEYAMAAGFTAAGMDVLLLARCRRPPSPCSPARCGLISAS